MTKKFVVAVVILTVGIAAIIAAVPGSDANSYRMITVSKTQAVTPERTPGDFNRLSITCPPGTDVVGGGWHLPSDVLARGPEPSTLGLEVSQNGPTRTRSWTVTANWYAETNPSTGETKKDLFTVYARCLVQR